MALNSSESSIEDLTMFEFGLMVPFVLALMLTASLVGYAAGSLCYAITFLWKRYVGFVLHETASVFIDSFEDAKKPE